MSEPVNDRHGHAVVTTTHEDMRIALADAALGGRMQATEQAKAHWERVLKGLQKGGIYQTASFIDRWLAYPETRHMLEAQAIVRGSE